MVQTSTFDAEGKHRLSDLGRGQDEPITLLATNADSGAGVDGLFRAGNVVCKDAAGTYVEANDALVVDSTGASITTSGHSNGNGDIDLVGNHGSISVTTSTGVGTEANNATDLNADAKFAAHYIATSAGGELTIMSKNLGDQEWFYMASTTMATAGFAEGVGNAVQGSDCDVRITEEHAQMKDDSGSAITADVNASRLGHYSLSKLIIGGTEGATLEPEHKAILLKRGCILDT